MKYENLLGMLSLLLAALSLRLRKWLKRPHKLSVNYQHGNDTLRTNLTISNSVEDLSEEG
jgi:hypothetical protein